VGVKNKASLYVLFTSSFCRPNVIYLFLFVFAQAVICLLLFQSYITSDVERTILPLINDIQTLLEAFFRVLPVGKPLVLI